MNDREALLRAIATNLDEDTPRLMYADLLEEIGGAANAARARFIRLQIDMVRKPARSWFANSDRICEAAQLAGSFAVAWLEELPQWARGQAIHQRLCADDFSRGFLETLPVQPKAFAKQGHELLAVAPIRRVIASNLTRSSELIAFLTSPSLSRIRSLSLPAADGDGAAHRICSHSCEKNLAALEELDLSGSGLTDTGASSLARAILPNLRILAAHNSRLTEAGAAQLLSAQNLPRLELLDVRGTPGSYLWAHQLRARFPGKQTLGL